MLKNVLRSGTAKYRPRDIVENEKNTGKDNYNLEVNTKISI